jgi:hypothetical protein
MRLTVRFQNGARAEVLLLGVSDSRARVVVAGRGTTEEWTVFDGQCFDERGRPVEVESALAIPPAEQARPRTLTAGGASN